MIMLKKDSGPRFEFDEAKSRLNKRKHGIDFVEAQELWLDPDSTELPARDEGEPRWVLIGMMAGRHWAGFITYRKERVRIISVRRARPKEVSFYERQTHQR